MKKHLEISFEDFYMLLIVAWVGTKSVCVVVSAASAEGLFCFKCLFITSVPPVKSHFQFAALA